MSKKKHIFHNVEGILETVKRGLCHRCGGCVGICPVNTLALNADGYPFQIGECTSCSLCTDICSGATADFPAIGSWLFGPGYERCDPLGEVDSVYVGHSTDEKIRWAGASGGVVTRLLMYLLESGKISGALVAGSHPDDSAMGMGYIARRPEELIPSSQSLYTTTPMLHKLKEISKDKTGRYAVVALPCHAHTLRKLQMKSATWRRRISLIVGLYCHYRLPHEATREVGNILASPGSKLSGINFRKKNHEGWSTNTVEMRFTDGSTWRSPFGPAQTVSLLAHCYLRGRCMQCVDALAEFADLAVGDPWIRNSKGEWKYFAPGGRSGVIVRTDTGREIFHEAVTAGALDVDPIPGKEVVEGQYSMIMDKYQGSPARMRWLRLFGKCSPEYRLESPFLSFSRVLKEGKFFLLQTITVSGPVRRFFVRLGFSRMGRAFMGYRRRLNRKKAVSRLKPTDNTGGD